MSAKALDQPADAAGRQSAVSMRAAAAARWLMQLGRWRRLFAAALAGAASILSMPPFFAWPVLFVTLPALVWLLESARQRPGSGTEASSQPADEVSSRSAVMRAAAVGWAFGFGFHIAGLYWLREAFLVTGGAMALLWPLGVVGLPAGLALFHAAAAAVAAAIPGPTARRVLALALALAATEWLRGHILTGFPWNVLGTALTYPLVLMQSVSVLGIYGLTLLSLPVFALPAVLLAGRPTSGRWLPLEWQAAAIAVGPVAALAIFGALRLAAPPPPVIDGVRLRLVQPSIPQREKWQSAHQQEFLRRHLALTLAGPSDSTAGLGPIVYAGWPAPRQSSVSTSPPTSAAPNHSAITHVIWPEAAMPFLPLQYPDVLNEIGRTLPPKAQLLAGILRTDRDPTDDRMRAFNSLAVFDHTGKPVAIYDKIHLVPFGEYLPFQSLLESIGLMALTRQRGGFTPGLAPRHLLNIKGLPLAGMLICYEAMFPAAIVQGAARPGVLINVTNDGWFGNSTGPRQHLHQSRLRAVEEGIPLLRVANNGVSAVFDPYGRELARLDLDVAGVIDTSLPAAIAPPLYARIGDISFWVLWIAGIVGLGISIGRNRSA